MTMTISAWWIPVILTVVLLAIMLRPYHRRGDYDFGGIFRIFWLLPIAGGWIVFMAILLWLR